MTQRQKSRGGGSRRRWCWGGAACWGEKILEGLMVATSQADEGCRQQCWGPGEGWGCCLTGGMGVPTQVTLAPAEAGLSSSLPTALITGIRAWGHPHPRMSSLLAPQRRQHNKPPCPQTQTIVWPWCLLRLAGSEPGEGEGGRSALVWLGSLRSVLHLSEPQIQPHNDRQGPGDSGASQGRESSEQTRRSQRVTG